MNFHHQWPLLGVLGYDNHKAEGFPKDKEEMRTSLLARGLDSESVLITMLREETLGSPKQG